MLAFEEEISAWNHCCIEEQFFCRVHFVYNHLDVFEVPCHFFFQVSELIIHTDDTARQIYFLNTFVSHEVPLMFVGNTGTGKSAITNNYLVRLPKET